MEKQTDSKIFKCRRLLIFILLLFSASAFAQNNVRISWEYARSLTCKPVSEYFFTNQDCAFTLDIEGINPEDITLSVNSVPNDVSFSTYKKESLSISQPELTGTRVILYFRFAKEGDYQIPPVNVTIGHGMYGMKFMPVTVYTNPRTIQPKVSLTFADEKFNSRTKKYTLTSGDHVIFTVNLQYATQLVNLKWSIPENSLFREIERFDTAEKGLINSNFSPDIVPVVTFDWQPLIPGTYSLPKMIVTASAYSGAQVDLSLPDFTFTVLAAATDEENEKSATLSNDDFSFAFESPQEEEVVEKNNFVEVKNIDDLYELRVKERHSFPIFSSARQNRIDAEVADGLKAGVNESNLILHYILAGLLILSVLTVIILFMLKRTALASAFLALALFLSVTGICSGISCGMKYGLFKGGYINTIPEDYVQSGVTLQVASRVKIEHQIDGWLFIRNNDTSGWVKEDAVLIIR